LLGDAIAAQLEELNKQSGEELKAGRYDKFRAFGCFEEPAPAGDAQ
jgi:acetyl-CoA carboxylase alpha subunit